MVNKDGMIWVRLDSALKDELARSAQADHRSLSSLVAKILADWLANQKQ
jgi:predicted HicB family RNase H-like nuclease